MRAPQVFDISVRQDSIAFGNGPRATMFGAGGTHFSWQERPSFQVVSGVILSLLSAEDQLLRSVQLIIDRHPAVVNAVDELGGGGSLLHFIIDRTNQPELLAKLLNADCRIGMQRDKMDRSPMQLAVQTGKWRSLQLLLEAIIHKRFSIVPGPMSLVNENLREMAYRYPLDFLSFISAIELQPEPEVRARAAGAPPRDPRPRPRPTPTLPCALPEPRPRCTTRRVDPPPLPHPAATVARAGARRD